MDFVLLGFLDWNFPLLGVGCEKKDILKNMYFIHLFFGCSGSSLLHGLLFSNCSKWGCSLLWWVGVSLQWILLL